MITIEVQDAEIQAALMRAHQALDDASGMMNEIGGYLRDQTEDRFASKVSPEGVPWAPRSAATLKNYERRKLKFGGVLHLSGQLGANIFHEYGPDWTQVGSPEVYAATMHFGAAQGQFGAAIGRTKPSAKRPKSQDYFMPLPWGNIPARPFLGLSDEDRTGVLDIIVETLSRQVAP